MIHTYSGVTLAFEIRYNKRSTIDIYVDRYGQIEVHAPKGTSIKAILNVMEQQWDGVITQSKQKRGELLEQFEKTYDPGELFLYEGKAYPIVISPNTTEKKDHVRFEQDKIKIYVTEQDEDAIRTALKRFYYKRCRSLVNARIKAYQNEFKVKPRSVSISDNDSFWGTCNTNRELTFNWKLAMAPVAVIDYVVVHEMCHMVHMNHDRSFWRLVGKLLPEYENRKQWLNRAAWRMTI